MASNICLVQKRAQKGQADTWCPCGIAPSSLMGNCLSHYINPSDIFAYFYEQNVGTTPFKNKADDNGTRRKSARKI